MLKHEITVNKFLLVLFIAGMAAAPSCKRNPITGRNQLSLVSENEVQTMALTQYKSFLTTNKVVPVSNNNSEMVKRVGGRISAAINKYYQTQGLASALADGL